MPGLREEQGRLTDRLREEVNLAHQCHLANEGQPESFRRALKRFEDFLLDGIIPLESKGTRS
jgi:hypothetical protein